MSETQRITLKTIALNLRVGVPEAERAIAQALHADIEIEIRDPPVFITEDNLAQTINYDHIIHFLRDDLPQEGPFALIETVADRICAFCLSLSAQVHEVDVRIAKPSVLPAEQGLVSISVRRTRSGRLAALKQEPPYGQSARRAGQP